MVKAWARTKSGCGEVGRGNNRHEAYDIMYKARSSLVRQSHPIIQQRFSIISLDQLLEHPQSHIFPADAVSDRGSLRRTLSDRFHAFAWGVKKRAWPDTDIPSNRYAFTFRNQCGQRRLHCPLIVKNGAQQPPVHWSHQERIVSRDILQDPIRGDDDQKWLGS